MAQLIRRDRSKITILASALILSLGFLFFAVQDRAVLITSAYTLSFTDIWGNLTPILGGHGAMWADASQDARPDLYLPLNLVQDGDKPDLLLINLGSGMFQEDAAARGIDDTDAGSHGAAWADLDNDGDYDLVNGTTYPSAGGETSHNNLFENGGSGFFSEATPQSMLTTQLPTRAVLTFDMDADGDLDIFAVSGSEGSGDPANEHNELYLNESNLQFSAITSGDLYSAPAGQGATDSDFDMDGDVDVMAGNRNGQLNILANNGSGQFTAIAAGLIGLTHNNGDAGDGITTADIDNDGDLDVLLSRDNQGKLFTGDGDGTFTFKQTFMNTAGYMGGFGDLDNDGDLDLVFAGDDVVYLNNGAGTFSSGPAIPVQTIQDPRGIAFADLDDDGDLDFAVGAKNSRNHLYRNNFNGGNWLKVKLISPQGQLGAFGAKVYLYPAGVSGSALLGFREAKSNYGYLAQDDPALHFGLGSHTSVNVTVNYLNGTSISLTDVAAGQTVVVDASNGIPPSPTAESTSTPVTTGTPSPSATPAWPSPTPTATFTPSGPSPTPALPTPPPTRTAVPGSVHGLYIPIMIKDVYTNRPP